MHMEKINVYVRKGADNNQRIISFDRPKDLNALTLLEKGLALDGNQVVLAVSGYHDGDGWAFTGPLGAKVHDNLPDALLAEEKALLVFLQPLGLEAVFA